MKYFWILFSFFFLGACSNGDEPAPAEAADTPETPAASLEVSLSEDQMTMAGIRTGIPQKRTLQTYVECTGMVELPPSNIHSVHSPVRGFVGPVQQLIGDYVRKGSLLTTIRHQDLIRLQQDFLQGQIRLDLLQKDLERKQTLAREDAASQMALQEAEAAFAAQQISQEALSSELRLIGLNPDELAETRQVKQALPIYAPVSGRLNKVAVNPGRLVNSEDLLYEVLDDDHIHLELKVFAKDIPHVREGQDILAQVSGQEQTVRAKVHRISPMIDAEMKTALVHGHLVNEEQKIFPGTYIQARIVTRAAEVLAVPEGAVVREGNLAFVFVRSGDGFTKTEVHLGMTDGKFIELLEEDWPADREIALEGAYYINGDIE